MTVQRSGPAESGVVGPGLCGKVEMIEKKPTSTELQMAYAQACIGAISGVIPLDIQHIMSAGCHLRWVMYGEKFGCMGLNNIAVLQDEKTGHVRVFEARPEGNILTHLHYDCKLMREFYSKGQ